MHVAVIGRGPIGSAAAKYLAAAGHRVTLIGPDEPTHRAGHTGVFGCHYDEGRITRALDADPFWSAVNRASIARYRGIEAALGLPFFAETGAMMAGPADGALMRGVARVAATGIRAERLEGPALAARFPFFRFAPDTLAFFEPTGAGHLSPRRLVAAQTRLAEAAGAQTIRATAAGLDETGHDIRIATDAGPVAADRVVVAAGAFTNALLVTPLPVKVYARTVAFFRIDAAERRRLAAMPSLVYQAADGRDPYLLPPIRYPDGGVYLKLGGDPEDIELADAAAAKAWFQSPGSTAVGAMLKAQILDRMPGLGIEAMHTEACATTFTPEDRPAIRMLSARVAVAAAGCGRGAKCSDELGRRAAETVAGGV